MLMDVHMNRFGKYRLWFNVPYSLLFAMHYTDRACPSWDGRWQFTITSNTMFHCRLCKLPFLLNKCNDIDKFE